MRSNIRQGDVLLRPLDGRLPPNLVAVPASEKEGVVLARGELHGHRHMLPYGGALMYMDAETGSRFLAVDAATKLEQVGADDKPTGDHAPLDVPKGNYEVIQQSQMSDDRAVGRVD